MPPTRAASTAPLFTRYRRASLLASALAGGLALVVLVLPLLGGSTYFGLDLDRCDRGLLCQLRDLLAQGGPLWIAPHLGNGSPLLARPEAQLAYPVRWLALALPLDVAVNVSPVLHLTLGAASAAWLARTFKLRPTTAASAGLMWALSGTVLNLIIHTFYVVAATWLPLVWAASRRASQHRSRRLGLCLGGLGLAALLLAGELQGFTWAAALVVMESVRGIIRGRGRRLRIPLSLLALVPVGFAIGSLFWLPLLAEVQPSERASPLAMLAASRWSLSYDLLPFILWPSPAASAHTTLSLIALVGGGGGEITAWNSTPYLGSLLLAAAVCGAFVRRLRLPAVVAIAALLLSLQPSFNAIASVFPPLLLFRYPEKYFVVTTLGACLVAAGFFDRLDRQPPLLRPFATASCLLLLFNGAAYFFFGTQRAVIDTLLATPILQELARQEGSMANALQRSVLQASIPLIAALLVLLLPARHRRHLPFLIALDLLAAAPLAVHVGPSLEDVTSPLRGVRAPGHASTVLCTHNLLERVQMDIGSGSYLWGRAAVDRLLLLPELQACEGISAPATYAVLQSRMNLRLEDAFNQYRLAPARALGCTHILSFWPMQDQEAPRLPLRFWGLAAAEDRRAELHLALVPDPVPPAFIAPGPQLATTEDAVLERVLSSSSAAQVLRIVDDPLHRLDAEQGLPDGSRAHIREHVRLSPSVARVVLDGEGGAVVGLRTAFAVGWHALQAGRELQVVRVTGQHLGAVVDDVGAGEVIFEYRSPHFALSVVMAVLGCAGLLALSLRPGLRSWRRARAR